MQYFSVYSVWLSFYESNQILTSLFNIQYDLDHSDVLCYDLVVYGTIFNCFQSGFPEICTVDVNKNINHILFVFFFDSGFIFFKSAIIKIYIIWIQNNRCLSVFMLEQKLRQLWNP